MCDEIVFLRPLGLRLGQGFTLTQCGKNLWDFKTAVERVTVTTKTDGSTASFWGHAVRLPAGEYTLHAEYVTGTANRYIYCIVNTADGAIKGDVNYVVANYKTYQPTVTLAEGDVLYVYNGNSGATEAGANNAFKEYNVQIECGATATPFEPYDGIRVPVGISNTPTLIARDGYNSIYAEVGTITVTGRLDPVHILQTLMGGDT